MRTFLLLLVIALGAYYYFYKSPLAETAATAGGTDIAQLLQGKLVDSNGSAVTLPAAGGGAVRYFAIYYSAGWCAPCHAFTPVLAEWYSKFKPAHPDFELVFVSEDRSEADMEQYQREMLMPWPAVRYSDLKHDGGFNGSGIEMFAGSGIPDLVLVDDHGKILSNSFSSFGSYLGPQHVLDDAENMVR